MDSEDDRHTYILARSVSLEAYDRKTASRHGVEMIYLDESDESLGDEQRELAKRYHIFAFRGTDTKDFFKNRGHGEDILRDIAFLPKKYDEKYVAHFGFCSWVVIYSSAMSRMR